VERYLNASEVAELAELLEEFPIRVGAVEEVLQAAAEKRGMTLVLRSPLDNATGPKRGPGRR
jgi:hypothetical protein